MSAQELVPRETSQALERHEPTTVLQMIALAARDPNVDVAKMRELLAMQKEIVAEERRISYVDAMRELQHELPQFVKSAKVVVKGTERSRFAPIEDIDAVLRPLCYKYGFEIEDDVKSIDSKNVMVVCRVSHKAGHFVEKTLPLPIDFSDYRSVSQSTVASVTLGKRHLRKMHFNIVERGEDTNGERVEKITESEALDLNTQLNDFAQESGAKTAEDFSKFRTRFFAHFKISAMADLLKTDHAEALQMLRKKQGAPK